MSKTHGLEQGSTLLWTEGYGSAETPGRRRDFVADLFYTTTLALLILSILSLT
jgi:hypothetical protein